MRQLSPQRASEKPTGQDLRLSASAQVMIPASHRRRSMVGPTPGRWMKVCSSMISAQDLPQRHAHPLGVLVGDLHVRYQADVRGIARRSEDAIGFQRAA